MINLYKFIDKYLGIPFCIIFGMLTKLRLFPKNKSTNFKKIIIIKIWALGDSVVSLPLIKTIKEHNPNAQIDVLARNRNADVFKHTNFINNIFLFEPKKFLQILKLIRKYDLIIDTEPYLRLSALLSLFLGKRRIGFANQIRSLIYTDSTPFRKDQHMVENYLDMARILGINVKLNNLIKLETTNEEKKSVDDFLKSFIIKKSDFLVGFCAGSAESAKTRIWPNERFAKVADELIKKYHAKIVFIGSKGEKAQIENILNQMKYKKLAVNSAGSISLRSTFYLIECCKLFISNDTGPMHIAAAQGVTTIGLFGPNTPILWAPFGEKNKSIYKNVECSPCIQNDKGITPDCLRKTDRYLCMNLITTNDVLNAVKECLK